MYAHAHTHTHTHTHIHMRAHNRCADGPTCMHILTRAIRVPLFNRIGCKAGPRKVRTCSRPYRRNPPPQHGALRLLYLLQTTRLLLVLLTYLSAHLLLLYAHAIRLAFSCAPRPYRSDVPCRSCRVLHSCWCNSSLVPKHAVSRRACIF